MVFGETAEVVDGEGYAFDKVGFVFVESAVAVGAECLKYAHEEVSPEVIKPLAARFTAYATHVEVVGQEFAAEGFGYFTFGTIEK